VECHICEVRSSVGYCVECHQLLCETCGVPCDQCRKMSCPPHIHETKSGKALCAGCYAERRAKKEAARAEVVQRHTKEHRDAVDTSFQTLDAPPEAAADEISNEALVLSARRVIEPWRFSLYIAVAGVAYGIVLLFFPNLQHVAFFSRTYPTGALLFVFIAFSGFWAWVGLRNEEFFQDRVKCFYGIGAALACLVLAFVTISQPPPKAAPPSIPGVQVRTGTETTEELEQWRDKALNKYNREQ